MTGTDLNAKDLDNDTFTFRYGSPITDNFAWEVRFGGGLDEDKQDTTRYDIDYTSSAFINYIASPDSELTAYTLLGFTRTKFAAQTGTLRSSITEEGYSYGVGVQYTFAGTGLVNLEYAKLLSTDYADSDAITLGIGFKF